MHIIFKRLILVICMLSPTIVTAGAHGNAAKKGADRGYIYCAAINLTEANSGRLARTPEKYSTPVPKGWTVVGTAGGDGRAKIIVCR